MKKASSIIFLIFWATISYAQTLSVTTFQLDAQDATANQPGTIVIDKNGERCSLIKIITTKTGFDFSADESGITKVEHRKGQIWVYLPHGAKRLSMSNKKYGSIDYQLPVTLQKAKTYLMELKAEIDIPDGCQRIFIKCNPSNAVVIIDGNMTDIADGFNEVALKVGSHSYTAMANGYYPTEGTIEVMADRPGRLSIDLERKEAASVEEIPSSSNYPDAPQRASDEVNALYFKAIDGDSATQYKLALHYDEGNGVSKDHQTAFEWYLKAAEQGMPEALSDAGYDYQEGIGVEKDLKKAVEFYTKAAEKGLSRAQVNLGICYCRGEGTEKNIEKAFEWFKKAAEQGNGSGYFQMALCYDNGNEVTIDKKKAVEYYTKAAELGHAAAQNNLALMYLKGEGVAKDKDIAKSWFEKAAAQGQQNAIANLKKYYNSSFGERVFGAMKRL